MSEFKKCNECGTENEKDYTYCKNCGATLPKEDGGQSQNTYNAEHGYGRYGTQNQQGTYSTYSAGPGFAAQEIEGIPTEDLVRFVGRNSDKIIGSWAQNQLCHSKTSWCWPVFVLTFFFGICGAAFWFLYRRMYKIGALILALALIIGIGQSVLDTGLSDFVDGYMQILEEYMTTEDDVQLEKNAMELVTNGSFFRSVLFGMLSRLLRTVSAVLLALFAYEIYRRHTVKKIYSYGRRLTDTELYLAGGTSGGAVAVGAVLYFMVSMIASVVTLIFMLAV